MQIFISGWADNPNENSMRFLSYAEGKLNQTLAIEENIIPLHKNIRSLFMKNIENDFASKSTKHLL